MKVEATKRGIEIVNKMRERRSGELVLTIGTGCCESTAPFLYEDYFPGTDVIKVGEAAGIPVFASQWLVDLYPDETLILDGETGIITETFSIEAEIDARLSLAVPAGGLRGGAEGRACKP